MPYVQIPKDLTKVKTKVLFNLTKRQLICFAGAAVTGVPFYLLTKDYLGTSGAALGMVALMLPCFFLAMYERDGQPLEKVLKNYIQSRFIRKRTRPYQTQNFYSYLQEQVNIKKEVTAIAKADAATGKTRKTAKRAGSARTGK